MKNIIILALLSLSLSSNIIMVGDSRTYLLAQYLFPIFQGNYPAITTTEPVYYGKHSVRFDCMPGATIYDFTSDKPLGQFLDNLVKVSPGAYVFLWVGVNNVAVQNGIRDTFNRYFELAQKNPQVNFIIFSIPGVNEQLLAGHHSANNILIAKFNAYMKAMVAYYHPVLPNLGYGNFMNEVNPTYTLDGKNIDPYLDAIGIHFDAEACKYFFEQMIKFLPDN